MGKLACIGDHLVVMVGGGNHCLPESQLHGQAAKLFHRFLRRRQGTSMKLAPWKSSASLAEKPFFSFPAIGWHPTKVKPNFFAKGGIRRQISL